MFPRSICIVFVASAGCMVSSPPASESETNDELQTGLVPAAQTFTALTNVPAGAEPGVALVLTDGRVITEDADRGTWHTLTPDNTGSYRTGTWTSIAAMPSGYTPLYFASAVLPDGRLIAEGGEYNGGGTEVWTSLGAIYDPVINKWTSITKPAAFTEVGDAQSVVLADGRFMLADCCTTLDAVLDPTNLTWTPISTGKEDQSNDEEGWTLLGDGRVLTVDSENNVKRMESEVFSPATGSWSSAGSTVVALADNSTNDSSFELGPDVLRPDGSVLCIGATGHNAVFNSLNNTWAAAPDFPVVAAGQLDSADGPAALMPNGNVLVATSPGVFNNGAVFFEWDGTSFNMVSAPANAPDTSSYLYNMVTLPSGEILVTSQSSDAYIYTPAAPADTTAIAPVITAMPVLETTNGFTDIELAAIRQNEEDSAQSQLSPQLLPLMSIYTGRTYVVSGLRLNGISQTSAYGDDAQAATNYPLVRFTNAASGHVQYARTHDGSNYSIAKTATGSTHVDIPATIEGGLAKMEVVANGIASPGLLVNVK